MSVPTLGAVGRNLDWDGCFNARDLGGLRTVDGRTTEWRAVVRADRLDRLTKRGWAALQAYGIRTIVDLLDDHEIEPDRQSRPEHVTTVRVPLDDIADTEFWKYCWDNQLDGTPLYYEVFLERKPERCAAAVAALARADPDGGVLFHCGGGRDRTGLIALLESLATRNTSARALLVKLLAAFDEKTYLLAAGLTHGDLAAIRARLVPPP